MSQRAWMVGGCTPCGWHWLLHRTASRTRAGARRKFLRMVDQPGLRRGWRWWRTTAGARVVRAPGPSA